MDECIDEKQGMGLPKTTTVMPVFCIALITELPL